MNCSDIKCDECEGDVSRKHHLAEGGMLRKQQCHDPQMPRGSSSREGLSMLYSLYLQKAWNYPILLRLASASSRRGSFHTLVLRPSELAEGCM
jgi:hypothetical protein